MKDTLRRKVTPSLEKLRRRPRARSLLDALSSSALKEKASSDAEAAQAAHRERVRILEERGRIHINLTKTLEAVKASPKLNPKEYAEKRCFEPAGTTVDIGPGCNPSGINRQFASSSRWLGFENFSFDDFSDGADDYFEKLSNSRPGEDIKLVDDSHFGHGDLDGNRYSLGDEEADEIYACRLYDKPSWGSEDNNDQLAMTTEIERMLKPGGLAMIGDLDRNLFRILYLLQQTNLELVFFSEKEILDELTGEKSINEDHDILMKDLGFSFPAPILIIARKPLEHDHGK